MVIILYHYDFLKDVFLPIIDQILRSNHNCLSFVLMSTRFIIALLTECELIIAWRFFFTKPYSFRSSTAAIFHFILFLLAFWIWIPHSFNLNFILLMINCWQSLWTFICKHIPNLPRYSLWRTLSSQVFAPLFPFPAPEWASKLNFFTSASSEW